MKTNKFTKIASILFLIMAFLIVPQYTEALAIKNNIGNISKLLNQPPNQNLNSKKVNQIIYPLLSTPTINKAGTNLTIKVDTQGSIPSNWNITIKNVDSSPIKSEYSLKYISMEKSSSYWKDSSSIYDVTVLIPDNVPENLYDLQVSYTTNGSEIKDSQPHSVKVVKEFNSNFKFMHLTDLHIGSPRNIENPLNLVQAGFWNLDENKRWLYLQDEIKEVNLQNPDFVIITGDIMFGQMNPLEYTYEYNEIYRVLQQFNVPIYLVPGNHDYYAEDNTLTDGAKFWQNYFGPDHFSFDYGTYGHFVGVNSFDWDKLDRMGAGGKFSVFTWGGQVRQPQLDWIKQDLEQNSKTASKDQVKVLFCHHNPTTRDRDIWPSSDPLVKKYWNEYDKKHNTQNIDNLILGEALGSKYDQLWHGEGAQQLIDLMQQYGVTTSIHGHTHIDNIKTVDNHLYVTTTATELSGSPYPGYRIFQKDGANFNSYIYSGTSNSIPIYQDGSTPSGIMSTEVTYSNLNNGSLENQKAIVYNRLDKDMTFNIPIYMKPGSYSISEGTVINTISNGDIQYYLVKVTVPARSSKEILISKK